jgi:diguanylate cyclase (GGDEF)-like protein
MGILLIQNMFVRPLPGGPLSVIASFCKKIKNEPYWLTSFAVTAFLLALRQVGGLQAVELFAFDRLVMMQADRGADPRLLVVEVTEADIRRQREWPMSDQTLANLLNQLQMGNPKAIGIDIYRDIPQGDGQQALSAALQKPNVIAITGLGMSEDDSIPPPPGMKPEQVGFNDFVIDPDGILRRSLLFASIEDDEPLYSFALQLTLQYLGRQTAEPEAQFSADETALRIGTTEFLPLSPYSGGYDNINAAGYQLLLDYRSADSVARTVTLTEALEGKIKPEWIKDKIVLVGVTAPSMKDFFYTPYSAEKHEEHVMPGVVVHAQIVSQLLGNVLDGQPTFWYWPQGAEIAWIWGWAMAGGWVVWRMKRSALLGVTLLAGLASIGGVCVLIFGLSGWIPMVTPALGLLLSSGALITYQVFYKSFYDSLTGLPNRALFVQQLKQALKKSHESESQRSLAILLLDLDHFKTINESFGPRFGDTLLTLAAERIKAELPLTAQLARIGGDEFAVLLHNLADVNEATRVADTLYNQLSQSFHINEQSLTTSFSIGIALNQSKNGEQAETLMQDAHRAMTRARALGKEHYEIFDPGMRLEAVKRFQLESELRRAVDKHEFLLYYQPIINLKTGKLAGFEALVRWQHPEQGFVSPGMFIPAAEESGLIVPIGSWILEEACAQMQGWRQQYAWAESLMVSVNLSAKQFNQENLSEEIASILERTGLDSHCLKLELTETAAMEDVNGTIDQLAKLKALNLKLSLDDFGTGYSSLSYLHQLPTDTLKVDQSFVGRMDQRSGDDGDIVRTIISLGHQLGMDVIAEGIETAEQLSGLRKLNCNFGQGYYFSKPLPKEAATEVVAEDKLWIMDADSEDAVALAMV